MGLDAVLKKGTEEVRTKDAVTRNIASTGQTIGLMFANCLGPRGADILVSDEKGDTFYGHDALTVLKAIRNSMSHPVARFIHEAVKTIDENVGDGGKRFCILLGNALKTAERLKDEGVRPANIVTGYSEAIRRCLETLDEISVRVDHSYVPRVVDTVLSRLPLIPDERNVLTSLVSETVRHVQGDAGGTLDIHNIRIKNKLGGDVSSSFLVKGFIVDKMWPGHLQMPRYIEKPKIAILTSPIEMKKSSLKYAYTVVANDFQRLKHVIDDVSRMYVEAARKLYEIGADVVIAQKELHDQVLAELAKLGIMSAYRFEEKDIEFMSRATGAKPVHNVTNIRAEDLGEAQVAKQIKIGGENWMVVDGCKNSCACTIVLRSNSFKSLKMYEKGVEKSLKVVKSFIEDPRVVPGGGATEMALATILRRRPNTLLGQCSSVVQYFADCLEKIPFQLAVNSGKDALETIASLRSMHMNGKHRYGVGMDGGVTDMVAAGVVEPVRVVRTVLSTLRETLVQLIRIDNVVISKQIKGNVGTR